MPSVSCVRCEGEGGDGVQGFEQGCVRWVELEGSELAYVLQVGWGELASGRSSCFGVVKCSGTRKHRSFESILASLAH